MFCLGIKIWVCISLLCNKKTPLGNCFVEVSFRYLKKISSPRPGSLFLNARRKMRVCVECWKCNSVMHTFLFAQNSIIVLPGVIFTRNGRILRDYVGLWLDGGEHLPRCTSHAPCHAEVAPQQHPSRALQACCSWSMHRR